MLCVSQFIQNLTSWKTTLISSFLILISIPGMVSQVCVKCSSLAPQEQARQLSQKLWGQSIRISMFLFMPMITLKMFATPLLRRKYPSLL
ncbi:Uncharacterised protein [Shigella sonnei]|nr:Uncharacterised protein [Shigella sonnei]CSI56239.1 Uncharacterised protein [Shigella sonnei]SRW82726.1 Uncharacterised protein [Shigella sonnei]